MTTPTSTNNIPCSTNSNGNNNSVRFESSMDWTHEELKADKSHEKRKKQRRKKALRKQKRTLMAGAFRREEKLFRFRDFLLTSDPAERRRLSEGNMIFLFFQHDTEENRHQLVQNLGSKEYLTDDGNSPELLLFMTWRSRHGDYTEAQDFLQSLFSYPKLERVLREHRDELEGFLETMCHLGNYDDNQERFLRRDLRVANLGRDAESMLLESKQLWLDLFQQQEKKKTKKTTTTEDSTRTCKKKNKSSKGHRHTTDSADDNDKSETQWKRGCMTTGSSTTTDGSETQWQRTPTSTTTCAVSETQWQRNR